MKKIGNLFLKEQLKISKKQSKKERYEYIASNFNPVKYSMKLEKYIINLEKENKKLKRIIKNELREDICCKHLEKKN